MIKIGIIFNFVSTLAMAANHPIAAPTVVSSPDPGKSGVALALPEDLFKLRDPFRMPEIQVFKELPRTDLEKYPVDSYKLIGVLTGAERLRALLLAPDGKSYFISEKMKIGIRGGTVQKIVSDSVKVREKIVNLVGQEENIDSEIRMSSDHLVKPKETSLTGQSSSTVRK